jgi:hypothetical protein
MAAQPKTRAMIKAIEKELPFDEMLARVSEGATQTQLANLVAERIGKPCSHYYINRWIHKDAERSEAWKEAKQIAANRYADEVAETIQSVKDGKLDPNSAKVISSNAQWLASRMSPRDWGDRVNVDMAVTDLTSLHLEGLRQAMRSGDTIDVTPDQP